MDLANAALLVIDVQKGFDDPVWGRRNNPGCEDNVAALISAWRSSRRPLIFVRHNSIEAGSPLATGEPGNAFKDVIQGEPDLLVTKHVNSAFIGEPDLHEWLQKRSIASLVLCGIQTNFCVETTARVAGNLDYDTYFVLDATHAFDQPALDGSIIPADELARVTASTLQIDFATVVSTAEVIAEIGRTHAA
jgi:nicotinamidase-related amidase